MTAVRMASVLALLMPAACGDGSRPATTGVATVVDTVAGVVHVRNSGTAPGWTAEPVLRLGSLDGGPEEFSWIRSVVADAEGNVYVADNTAGQVRVFAPDGRHLRHIGRQGAGPGEFGDLYSLAWLDGSLAAMDPRNARIAVVSRSGEWIDAIQHFPITGPPLLVRLHPLGDAGFYAPTVAAERQALTFVRLTAAGPADTITPPGPPAWGRQTGVFCRRPDGALTSVAVPQAPAMVYAFPPRGGEIAVSWTERYHIAVLDARGDTLRVVTRDRPPVPYTDELWEEAMRPYRELRENFPGAECQPSEPRRPPQRAALRHVMFDEAGRLWIEAASEDGFVWEVFDSEGRLLGAAPAPPRSAGIPPYVRHDHLYQVETDDVDVQYVAAYRIGARPGI